MLTTRRRAAAAIWIVAVAAAVLALAAPAAAEPTPAEAGASSGVVLAADADADEAATSYLPPIRWQQASNLHPSYEPEGLIDRITQAADALFQEFFQGLIYTPTQMVWAGATWLTVLVGGVVEMLLYDRGGDLNEAVRNVAIGADGEGGIVGAGVLWLLSAVALLLAGFAVLRGNVGGSARALLTFFLFSGLSIAMGLTALGDGSQLPRASPVWWAQQVEQVTSDLGREIVGVLAAAPLTIAGDAADQAVEGDRDLDDAAAADALSCPAYTNQLLREYRERATDSGGIEIAVAGLYSTHKLDPMRFRLGTAEMTCHLMERAVGTPPSEQAQLTYAAVRSAGSNPGQPDACAFGYDPEACDGHDDASEREVVGAQLLAIDACTIPAGQNAITGSEVWHAALRDSDDLDSDCADWWSSGTPPPTLQWEDRSEFLDELDGGLDADARVVTHALHAYESVYGSATMALPFGLVLLAVAFIAAGPLVIIGLWVVAKSIEFALWVVMLPATFALTALPRLRGGDLEVGSAASRWAWKRTFDSALATLLGNIVAALYVHIFILAYVVITDLVVF